MDLVTLVTACALAVDPKLMHALIWQQSGGEPWAISVQGEPSPRVYSSMRDAIRETREIAKDTIVRVGLAGVPVPSSNISASVLLPCRNVAMAAVQISRNAKRCTTHPRLKSDPMFCAAAVYRGSWDRPDVKFATAVAATAAKGDAPDFDMPRDTSTDMFDIADDQIHDAAPSVIDITAAFADQVRSWSSALFPSKLAPSRSESERSAAGPSPPAESSSSKSPVAAPAPSNPQDRDLFVRRAGSEHPR